MSVDGCASLGIGSELLGSLCPAFGGYMRSIPTHLPIEFPPTIVHISSRAFWRLSRVSPFKPTSTTLNIVFVIKGSTLGVDVSHKPQMDCRKYFEDTSANNLDGFYQIEFR
ncbi:hypothetical protein Pelo_14215 [Pelomyxa schiedti]|nr:hypothetical protein Pelo_14215 [Pelomyxa schiedti]